MLLDHRIPKPPSIDIYGSHRLIEGLTNGRRPLFVDMGDHLILRSPDAVTETYRPVPEIHQGEIRSFELRVSCGVKNKGRHRYYPLKDWRARHDWLRRRASSQGFEVLAVNVMARRLKVAKSDKSFWMDSSDFTGVLRITDADAFRTTLADGFPGPGRAFGHGMLII